MSRTLSRVAGGALGVIVAAAIGDVATARAQTTPTTGPGGVPAVSTDCGSGTLVQCSTQNTFTCEWNLELSYNPLTRGFTFSFKENCLPSGTRPIYKDRMPTYTNGGCTGIGVAKDTPDGSDETC